MNLVEIRRLAFQELGRAAGEPCELHGIQTSDCLICWKPPGTCGWGDCQGPETEVVDSPGERRRLCARHALVVRPLRLDPAVEMNS